MSSAAHLKQHQFKPGGPGGPGRSANWLKPGDIKHVVGDMMKMTRREMKEFLDRDSATMLEIIIGQILFLAAKNGDPHRMEFILSRVLGRVKDVIEEQDDDGNKVICITRPDGSVVRIGPAGIVDPNEPQEVPEGTEPPMTG
jgi:hypothetical protein